MNIASRQMRLILVSDGLADRKRLVRIVSAAVAGGLRAVQLREPALSVRELASLCAELRPVLHAVNGLLLVNDRADLVAAGLADGVHLGAQSLPPARVRAFLPDALIGFSAHDPTEIAWAREQGADYVSLSPVLPSSCKPGQPAIGIERAQLWTREAGLPVIWLGGINAACIGELPDSPAGLALRSGLCGVEDPEAVVRRILAKGRDLPLHS